MSGCGETPPVLGEAPGAVMARKGAMFGQSVGFLLSQVGFEVARRFGKLMGEVDIEPRQFALMRTIESSEGQTQNAVGDLLRIPASSLVAVIDHLEARNLVERRPHPSDRRSRTLHITAHGREVLDRATELAMGLERVVCQGLTSERRAELLEMLQRVAQNLGLVLGLHPDTSTGHGKPHWTDEPPFPD